MFQSGALFGSMSLLENVMLPLEMLHRPAAGRAGGRGAGELGLVGLAEAALSDAGGNFGRHGEAGRHRAGDGARSAAAVS